MSSGNLVDSGSKIKKKTGIRLDRRFKKKGYRRGVPLSTFANTYPNFKCYTFWACRSFVRNFIFFQFVA